MTYAIDTITLLRSKSLSNAVQSELERRILYGELLAGERINENTLAAELGITGDRPTISPSNSQGTRSRAPCALHLYRHRSLLQGGGIRVSNTEHRRIVEALRARDPVRTASEMEPRMLAGRRASSRRRTIRPRRPPAPPGNERERKVYEIQQLPVSGQLRAGR